jgi:hypothetical protein
MSELMNQSTNGGSFRPQLLTTVSLFALLSSIYLADDAKAADDTNDRPTVWIELGGQLERQTGLGAAFAPPFIAANPDSAAFKPVSLVEAQNPPNFSFGGDGRISFQPEDSRWVFSAAIRYGRSNSSKRTTQSTPGRVVRDVFPSYYGPGQPYIITQHVEGVFADVQTKQSENHAILDFQVGRDVGLGLFGKAATSVLNLGVRFAQFASKMNVTMHAIPNIEVTNFFGGAPSYVARGYYFGTVHYHHYTASEQSTRSFHGIGPSLSWTGSIPIFDNPETSEIAIDWGANAAILFGRQRASGSLQSGGGAKQQYGIYRIGNFNRDRSVIAPNAGGLAGISFRYANAKISLGYRGDFFFGAMDAGDDMRKTQTVGFYGPFASISVGIGG